MGARFILPVHDVHLCFEVMERRHNAKGNFSQNLLRDPVQVLMGDPRETIERHVHDLHVNIRGRSTNIFIHSDTMILINLLQVNLVRTSMQIQMSPS